MDLLMLVNQFCNYLPDHWHLQLARTQSIIWCFLLPLRLLYRRIGFGRVNEQHSMMEKIEVQDEESKFQQDDNEDQDSLMETLVNHQRYKK